MGSKEALRMKRLALCNEQCRGKKLGGYGM